MMKLSIFFIVLIGISHPIIGFADKASPRECQIWKQKAKNYQDKRRKGGSAKQMERWKTKKRTFDQLFRSGQCQKK